MRAMAQADLAQAVETSDRAMSALKSLLRPNRASADTNAMVEITPGVGGLEANAFARELAQLYREAALKKAWSCRDSGTDDLELLPAGEATISLDIRGDDSYNTLRLESGVHRVQRVPETESKGRIHTSAAAVIVLPLAPKSQEGEEKLWQPSEIRMDTMRSGGRGGQSVNKTESAVRVTHIPTGIAVRSDVHRNQLQNKESAFEGLRARLLKMKQEAETRSIRDNRASQVTSTDRSDKIRTYNYPGDRITDHRVPITVNGIATFMEGGDLFDTLQAAVAEKEFEEHIEALLGSDDG